MGLPISRATDITTGHGCFPPEVVSPALVSPDVYVEKQRVLRQGDKLLPHCCGNSCHQGVAIGGSNSVFVNKESVMRLTEEVACGSPPFEKIHNMMSAAARTFAGGETNARKPIQ